MPNHFFCEQGHAHTREGGARRAQQKGLVHHQGDARLGTGLVGAQPDRADVIMLPTPCNHAHPAIETQNVFPSDLQSATTSEDGGQHLAMPACVEQEGHTAFQCHWWYCSVRLTEPPLKQPQQTLVGLRPQGISPTLTTLILFKCPLGRIPKVTPQVTLLPTTRSQFFPLLSYFICLFLLYILSCFCHFFSTQHRPESPNQK